MRGLKGSNYWVMETTAGPRGGGNASIQLDKGAMRAAIWADIGHGADLISYWLWRDSLNGGEANHGAIVDVDGEPDPIYAEYAQIGREFEKGGPCSKGNVRRRPCSHSAFVSQPLGHQLAQDESRLRRRQ